MILQPWGWLRDQERPARTHSFCLLTHSPPTFSVSATAPHPHLQHKGLPSTKGQLSQEKGALCHTCMHGALEALLARAYGCAVSSSWGEKAKESFCGKRSSLLGWLSQVEGKGQWQLRTFREGGLSAPAGTKPILNPPWSNPPSCCSSLCMLAQ